MTIDIALHELYNKVADDPESTHEQITAVNTLVEWINGQKNFLVFLAPPGIGKTYLCSALIEKFYGKMENFRYWQEIDLISALKEHMHRHNHISTLKMLIDCDFLMYDDLCSSMVTDWKTEVLFSLINIRYISKKPTIITSNLSKQGLIEALPARATSRLFAKENLIIEIQNGQDLRAHGY